MVERAQDAATWVEHVGVASVCFFMLMAVCWYFVKREKAVEVAHEKEKDKIRLDNQAIITQKNEVIDKLAQQIDNVTAQSNQRGDRIIQMLADSGVRTEQVLADNAAAQATSTQAVQDLRLLRGLGLRQHEDEKDKPTPLVERLQQPPDSTDLRAQEALEKSADACTTSQILDDKAMEQLKAARKRTDTQHRKVKANHEQISSVLEGDEEETAAERGLRELEEEERRRARA